MTTDLPNLSVVVIGLNEAANLHQTFSVIRQMNYAGKVELIYVDSGSQDSSVEIARQYCDKVFIEPSWPTAARNRNRGLIESSYDYCHFMDGDIVMDADYLARAVEKIREGEVQCVFGYLEEKSDKGLSKILLHDYRNRKPGLIDSPGAGGTFLKKALVDVNGWDERIPRGEEMEIGDRLRAKGYKIWYLDAKMGIHDFGVTNIFKLFRKQIGEGKSIAQVTLIPVSGKFFDRIRKLAMRNIQFHLLLGLVILASVVLGSAWILLAGIVFYLSYLFVKHWFLRKVRSFDSLVYHYLKNLTKTFELYGYLKFLNTFAKLPAEKKAALFERMDIGQEILKKQ